MEILSNIYNKVVWVSNLEYFGAIIMGIMLIIIIASIINSMKTKRIIKKYNSLMKKLGNGSNLETMLRGYIDKVEKVESKNAEVLDYCKNLDNKMMKCIQKVGIVRYNAFEDTGSDLCFAIALLDFEDTGVVINGIYSREGSSTYGKPVEKGASKYTLSTEEMQAIDMAKRNAGSYYANV